MISSRIFSVDVVVIFPFNPDALGPKISSAIKVSFLVVTQSFSRLFSMIIRKSLAVCSPMVTCSCLADVALRTSRFEYLVF